MRLAGLLLVVVAAGAGAGCAAARVSVVDAVSGQPVRGAEVAIQDRQAGVLASRHTDGDGEAGLPAPAGADTLTITASGYRTWGTSWAGPPPATLHVALQPAYVDAFMGSGAAGMDAPTAEFVTPKHCHCGDAR